MFNTRLSTQFNQFSFLSNGESSTCPEATSSWVIPWRKVPSLIPKPFSTWQIVLPSKLSQGRYAVTPAVSQLASQRFSRGSDTSKLRCPSNQVKPQIPPRPHPRTRLPRHTTKPTPPTTESASTASTHKAKPHYDAQEKCTTSEHESSTPENESSCSSTTPPSPSPNYQPAKSSSNTSSNPTRVTGQTRSSHKAAGQTNKPNMNDHARHI